MKIKTVNIESDVESVLRAATLDGNNMTLNGQLDRALYQKVMKVLEHIGFKWNRKLKCHVGDIDSAKQFHEALDQGKVVDEKKTYQFFATPDILAKRMAKLAQIKSSDLVLEPSAGKGALIKAIHEACPDLKTIFAYDINPKMIDYLSALDFVGTRIKVTCSDFLLCHSKFDKIVMNPPFTGMQDVSHVMHAYDLLYPEGKLVSVMSPSWKNHSCKKAQEFREWFDNLVNTGCATIENVPHGTFSESGTEIATILVSIIKQ